MNQEHGSEIPWEKSKLCFHEVEYLRYVITHEGINPQQFISE